MKRNFKTIITVALVAAVSIGGAFLLRDKPVKLNVTAMEAAILERYPAAVITGIERSNVDEEIYTVQITLGGAEYKLFVSGHGDVLNANPPIPAEFENSDSDDSDDSVTE